MNNSLTDAIKEAFASAPTNVVVHHTIEIRQDGVQPRIYLVRARHELVAQDEEGNTLTFEPAGFQFTLPPSSEEGFQSINIAIDNIDQRVTDFVKLATSERTPVQVIYRPYLSTDLTQPQMDPPLVLYLRDIQANIMQVTGRATFMDVVNKRFPSILYSRDGFPGLG